jgi:hypothetical protein
MTKSTTSPVPPRIAKAREAVAEAERAVRERHAELRAAHAAANAAPSMDQAAAVEAARQGKAPEPSEPELRAAADKARLAFEGAQVVLAEREEELRDVILAQRKPLAEAQAATLNELRADALGCLDRFAELLAQVEAIGGTLAALYAADRASDDRRNQIGRRVLLKSTLLGGGSRPVRVDPQVIRESASHSGRADSLLALVATALAEYDPTPMRVKILDAVGDRIVSWDQVAEQLGVGPTDSRATQARNQLVAERTLTKCNAEGDADPPDRGELRVNSYLRRTTLEERETPTQRARRQRREREAA